MEASLMGIPGRYRTLFLSDNLFILFHFYREIVKNTGRNPKYISTNRRSMKTRKAMCTAFLQGKVDFEEKIPRCIGPFVLKKALLMD